MEYAATQDVDTLFVDAVHAREEGDAHKALALLGHALALDPGHRPSRYLMGHFLAAKGEHEAALAHLLVACDGTPPFLPARHEFSQALLALERWKDALDFSTETLRVAPSAQAHYYRGTALAGLERFEEAVESFDRALAIEPAHVHSLFNRADAMYRRWKLQSPSEAYLHAALAGFSSVVELRPDMAKGHQNLGFVLEKLNRLDESIASLDRSIALDPHNSMARYSLACSLIAKGEWTRGWVEMEHRFTGAQSDNHFARQHIAQPGNMAYHVLPRRQNPAWQGEPLAGKRILLLSEGGFGDVIQFYRFVPAVVRMAAKVDVILPRELQALLAPDQEPPDLDGDYDFHCSLVSLPLALKARIDAIPGVGGYLKADPARVDHWRKRLGERRGPRVGLVWSGSTVHTNDINRSMRLADLRPLLQADAEFVCLQKFVRDTDRKTLASLPGLSFHGEQLDGFADTAALCELMDLVITVDTSMAHLAGAMGKPVWIMLPRAAEWRWMADRADSPWYAGARLFRQHRQGEWQPVVQRVAQALEQCFASDLAPVVMPDSTRHPHRASIDLRVDCGSSPQ